MNVKNNVKIIEVVLPEKCVLSASIKIKLAVALTTWCNMFLINTKMLFQQKHKNKNQNAFSVFQKFNLYAHMIYTNV